MIRMQKMIRICTMHGDNIGKDNILYVTLFDTKKQNLFMLSRWSDLAACSTYTTDVKNMHPHLFILVFGAVGCVS